MEIVKKYVSDTDGVHLDQPVSYLYARVDTGEATPTDKELSIRIFKNDGQREVFGHSNGSDLYIYPVKFAGKVMVD